MSLAIGDRIRSFLTLPRYIGSPLSGIDLSEHAVRAVSLSRTSSGLVLSGHGEARLLPGAYNDGEIADSKAIIAGLWSAAGQAGVSAAHVALPETRAYLFETEVAGTSFIDWKQQIESQLPTLIHAPAHEVSFAAVPLESEDHAQTMVAGVAASQKVIDATLLVFDHANLEVHSFEVESFSLARALLPRGDESSSVIIDMGKNVTTMTLVTKRIPRRSVSIPRGGHVLISTLQKTFRITESEARRMLAEQDLGSVPGTGKVLHTMLAALAPIRSELATHLRAWQRDAETKASWEPFAQVILAGSHALVLGLAEYMEEEFRLPVRLGDVFTNLVSPDERMSALPYEESLGYATAVGLALRGDYF